MFFFLLEGGRRCRRFGNVQAVGSAALNAVELLDKSFKIEAARLSLRFVQHGEGK
jgi:hypothetical protein